MLSISDLVHRYGALDVLRGVSVELAGRELLCLLGPSGCGKTTLLRLAAGIERSQHGEIRIAGDLVSSGDGTHIPPEARQVGMMFQDFALFPHLTVRDNLMFGVRDSKSARAAWIQTTATRMGIGQLLDKYPGTLSGGQQQRVALIRALAPNPRVLLLDEPFSGLDAVRRADVREQTQTLIQETDIAALMVTHDPEEAMFMADKIAVMHEGRIIQTGSPDQVYFNPHNAFVASLFGPLNQVPADHPLVAGCANPSRQPGPAHAGGRRHFRPNNLQPVATGTAGSSPALIRQARRLGNEIQLRLELAPVRDGASPLLLQARWPAVSLPTVGEAVQVVIRHPDQVFAFSKPISDPDRSVPTQPE